MPNVFRGAGLRWAAFSTLIVASGYVLACGGLPTASDAPAAVNVSGEELAPAAAAPAPASGSGVLAGLGAEARSLVADLGSAASGRASRRQTARQRKLAANPDEQCYCCCCDPCGDCGGGGGGYCDGGGGCGDGGCSSPNYSCVQDGTIVNPAAACGAADQYPLDWGENGTYQLTGTTVSENTACTPNTLDSAGNGYACSTIYLNGGSPPTNGGSCTSTTTTVRAPAPKMSVDSSGYVSWTTYMNMTYWGNTQTSCATNCWVEQFSYSTVPTQAFGPATPCN